LGDFQRKILFLTLEDVSDMFSKCTKALPCGPGKENIANIADASAPHSMAVDTFTFPPTAGLMLK